ncbi:MAG: T9SS type A sorting domain-containing protein [Saprospiraceae bacterium]
MRSLFVFLLANYFALAYHQAAAQSAGYTIESFQDVYTELTNYESVSLLTMGDLFWELEFPLNFQFPFYDSLYESVIYHHEAWGMFTDDEDLALFLMDFTRLYAFDDLVDTSNITSDVRFSHVMSNNLQAFVLQFTKNRFFADPYEDSLDTYLNFQIWLYENGVMEVHFGEMHMDGNPIYAPGKGFYCYTTSGGIDTNEVCGPHMGISNPLDEEDAIALSGSYDDYEVVGDLYSVLTVLPPEGWIIRFKPKSVGIFDPVLITNQLAIKPNPTSSYILIPDSGNKVTIFDFSGKIVYEGTAPENKVSVSTLPTGMYFIQISSDYNSSIGRFFKL